MAFEITRVPQLDRHPAAALYTAKNVHMTLGRPAVPTCGSPVGGCFIPNRAREIRLFKLSSMQSLGMLGQLFQFLADELEYSESL